MDYDSDILKSPNGDNFIVRTIMGGEASEAYRSGNIDELLRQDGQYAKRTFPTIEEARAYMTGIRDRAGWQGHAFIPAIEAEPYYLLSNPNCRWQHRLAFPSYAIVFLLGEIGFEEYINYYGENGREDVENYKAWYERYMRQFNLTNNRFLHYVLVEENSERPSTSFTPNPIFGKACDTILIDVYLITTGNGTEATH